MFLGCGNVLIRVRAGNRVKIRARVRELEPVKLGCGVSGCLGLRLGFRAIIGARKGVNQHATSPLWC